MKRSTCFALLACTGILLCASKLQGELVVYQPCFERPVFERPAFVKDQRERRVVEKPVIARPAFEKPQRLTRMLELPEIETMEVDQVRRRACAQQPRRDVVYQTPPTPGIIVDKWGNISANLLRPKRTR